MKENINNISIIICTYNRANHLDKTLKSICSHNLKNIEIVVVNGPSNDNTEVILSKYPVKVISQKSLGGLSEARNLGINGSNGDILIFIDDDAIPDENWLNNLINPFFSNESICGVGGTVIEYPTNKIQFMNGTVSIYGKNKIINNSPQSFNNKYGTIYNNVMGTNMAFRKKALHTIGGFDPYYKYYFDETDLAIRLINSGYKIIHEPMAIVYHESANGPNRKSKWDVNWYMLSKTNTYFAYKNFAFLKQTNLLKLRIGTLYILLRKIFGLLIYILIYNMPVQLLPKLVYDIFKGYIDGFKDGMTIAKNNNRGN